MAVVNVTPDSFFDGGLHASTTAAIDYALRCIDEGADILDIGGESTRPGSDTVSLDEELSRVIPVIEGIRSTNATIPISVDTTKAAVIREAARHTIHYANDVSSLRADPEMATTVAQLSLNVILMHMQGNPKTMQVAPEYKDVVEEVKAFFKERMDSAVAAGISKTHFFLDPGIGFGKTVAHNVTLLKHLSEFNTLGCPLVVGTSRKSFIGKLSGTDNPEFRLPGSLATLPAMLRAKVAIVRTHDVAATRQFLQVVTAL